MKKICLAAIAVLLVSLPALAQDKETADEVRELQRKVRALREEISRLHLLNTIELTLEQAQQLKALLDNVKLARELFNQQTIACQKEMVEVLQKIRDALAEGAEAPPEELVEEYTELRKKNAEVNKEFVKKVKEADKELNSLLSPEQGKAIENYDGDVLRPQKDGPQAKGSRLAQAAKLLDRVVRLNPEQLEQAKEKLFQQFLGKLTRDRNVPRQHIQSVRRKLDEIINKARKMDELEYMLWREEFAKQLLELGNPPKRTGRRADRRQKGPELSKAATVLLDEGMLKALESRIEALKEAGEKEPAGPEKEESKDPSEE